MRGPWCRCALALLVASAPSRALAQAPAGGEFRVNSYTVGMQTAPDVGVDASGALVVAWSGQYGSVHRVYAQRFDPGGAPRGAEFQLSASTTSFVNFGSIAVGRRGGFIAAWQETPPGDLGEVVARTFDAAGNARGAQFVVNTYTTGTQRYPRMAALPGGRYVVVWEHWPPGTVIGDVSARLFDADGNALAPEFAVNTYTTLSQGKPRVAAADDGRFVVVWHGDGAGGFGIFGQRFDSIGARVGEEFRVNEITFGSVPAVSLGAEGQFVVVWGSADGSSTGIRGRVFDRDASPMGSEFVVAASTGIALQNFDVASDRTGNFTVFWQGPEGPDPANTFGRRYSASGAPRGVVFRVNTYTTGYQQYAAVASDPSGNVIASWASDQFDTQFISDVYAQRYGGLLPSSLAVVDGDQGVLDVPDDFFLRTAWRNVTGVTQAFQGRASEFDVPPGMLLTLSTDASYATVPAGTVGTCGAPCFSGALLGTRPPGHVDIRFTERILPEEQGQAQRWTLHVGGSFTDVLRTNTFYPFVETLIHHGVTSGCAGLRYCPAASTTREQMAVFVLTAKEGPGYAPLPCTTPVFNDVPASSPFCRWIEELARRGVTSGCGGGNYCASAAVSREQMAVFVLRTLDPNLDPPACTTPVFSDVPADSPFCRWIEELVRRGVVSGCAAGRYCPADPVTREQMAVFLTGTFGLTLYGP